MHIYKNKKGFTLIELLVVVAIISLSALVVLVSMSNARNNANASVTKSTLSSLKSSLAQCCSNWENSINSSDGGELVCSASGSTPVTYPTPAELKLAEGGTVEYDGVRCTVSNPSITVNLTGHQNANCNTPNYWTLEIFGELIPPSGC